MGTDKKADFGNGYNLHLTCDKCNSVHFVYLKDAKEWRCQVCYPYEEENDSAMKAASKEIDVWRHHFLEKRFFEIKYISDEHRRLLTAYFMSTPSSSFTNPEAEWSKSISALLQKLGVKK
jgi:hypothetical protein